MKRLAFNGGEISPNMALRADMDTYARSCTTLTNFDVHTTGGISRRRGMRLVDTHMPDSLLIPFRASGNKAYLIVLDQNSARIYDPATDKQIAALAAPASYSDLSSVTYLQINALLLICAPDAPVAQIRLNGTSWTFRTFSFKTPPWQTEDYQNALLTLQPFKSGSTTLYHATIAEPDDDDAEIDDDYDDDDDDIEETAPDDNDDDALEDLCEQGEKLRASYYTERQEASATIKDLTTSLTIITTLNRDTPHTPGTKLAIAGPPMHEYYICTQKWTGKDDLTAGFTSPANYKDHFAPADDISAHDEKTATYALTAADTYEKGDKITLITGQWHLWTCIKTFTASDFITGRTTPADYPDHFAKGLAIGSALPCRGKWLYYCSGTWYGSYEVRRSYKTPDLTGEWESIKESVSPLTAAENNLIEGDEEEEECYLRLFITTVKNINPEDPSAAWPLDTCGNKLIVYSYQKHITLERLAVGDFKDISPIPVPLPRTLTTADWSLQAFRAATGYPRLATLHESRLYLASTYAQPQTIWASRTDDLNNFATGDLDTAGLLLEMQTGTQASICWMTEHGSDILLGTEDAEWVLTARNDATITAENATLTRRGHHGSSHQPAILADDSVLYCARGEGRVYEYLYNYELNGYTSKDLTIFADHIATAEGGITGGTVINKPQCVAVFTTRSGNLLLMTYNTFHNVNAWHRYTTAGKIERAAAIPCGDAADKLYLIVSRNNTRYLECIDNQSPYTDGVNNAKYTSEMTTTAFSVHNANDTKRPLSPLQIYIQGTIPAENLTLSLGEPHRPINRTAPLTTGWHDLLTPAAWRWAPQLSLRLTGGPATILALQI